MSSKVIKVTAKAAAMEKKELRIKTDFIKLDAALKFAGEAGTGGEAKMMIAEGKVFVNGGKCTERGKKLYPGDTLRFGRSEYKIIKDE